MEKKGRDRFGDIIGKSQVMRRVYRQIEKVAQYDVPVLIAGETGTGKDMVAMEIHRASNKPDELFFPINMGAIPKELVGSTLFGHEKGAFTGAVSRKKGLFETASGGTLFLDEIGTIDEQTQIALLRTIEDKKVRRVGGTSYITCDVRLIAATNINLADAVASGEFREDLYYRLNIFSIYMPPLRKRRGDIMVLAETFSKRYAKEFAKDIRGFSQEAKRCLNDNLWPGNVRELENAIIRSVINADRDIITPDLLNGETHPSKSDSDRGEVKVGMTLEEAERELIMLTLKQVRGHKGDAARMLGLSRKGFYNKLKKYNL